VLKATLRFESGVKRTLTGPRTGRIYTFGKRQHQASAPGEAPALLTGQLRNSITHTMPHWDTDNQVRAEVGTALLKAAILEFGGVAGNGARILPRPYIEVTWVEMQDELESILEEAIKT
jgi:phage gpG-like protein